MANQYSALLNVVFNPELLNAVYLGTESIIKLKDYYTCETMDLHIQCVHIWIVQCRGSLVRQLKKNKTLSMGTLSTCSQIVF